MVTFDFKLDNFHLITKYVNLDDGQPDKVQNRVTLIQ